MTDTSLVVSDYESLQTAIASEIIRSDLALDIPKFIRLCEADLRRRLNSRYLSTYSKLTISGDDELQLPSDFNRMENIQVIGSNTPIEYVSQNYLDGLEANPPCPDALYYTIQGTRLLFYPAPIDGTQVAFRYQAKVPYLTDVQPTNVIMDEYPDLYLYGSLLHTAPFLNDDERLGVWASLYRDIITEVNNDTMHGVGGVRMSMRAFQGTQV